MITVVSLFASACAAGPKEQHGSTSVDTVTAETMRLIRTEGTIELMLGTVSVLKSGMGILVLVLLLCICAAPLLYLYIVGFLLELVAAFTGIVAGKQVTLPIHRTAESIYMILKITATAMLLFLLSVSMVTLSTAGIR